MFKITVGPKGTTPTRGSEESAGYDIRSAVDLKITPGKQVAISTQIHMQIPIGWVGFIKSRSGLALKHCIEVKAGVIDSDYRGEVKVLLYNYGESAFSVKKGDKIAQLVIIPCMITQPMKIGVLNRTGRGSGGFGSTGK